MWQIADSGARAAMLHVQRGVGLADVVIVAVAATSGASHGARLVATIFAHAIAVSLANLLGAAALALVAAAVDVRLLAVLLAISAARFDTNVVGADAAGAVVVIEAAVAGQALLAVRAAAVHARLARALQTVGARLELTRVFDARLGEAVGIHGAIPPVLAGLTHAAAIDIGLATIPIAVFAQLIARETPGAATRLGRNFERGRVARSTSSERGRK